MHFSIGWKRKKRNLRVLQITTLQLEWLSFFQSVWKEITDWTLHPDWSTMLPSNSLLSRFNWSQLFVTNKCENSRRAPTKVWVPEGHDPTAYCTFVWNTFHFFLNSYWPRKVRKHPTISVSAGQTEQQLCKCIFGKHPTTKDTHVNQKYMYIAYTYVTQQLCAPHR